MPRFKEPPVGFDCPYKHHCPYLEGLSTHWVFSEYQRLQTRENEHWRTRDDMAKEINQLLQTVDEQAIQIDQLRAEDKRLHQHTFKPRKPRGTTGSTAKGAGQKRPPSKKKKRGAPKGHRAWTRPDRCPLHMSSLPEAN